MASIVLMGLLFVVLTGALYGIPLHFYGRYISKRHPNLWKELGSPSLTTAQGPRRDRLSEWISEERYLRISDEQLVSRGQTLRVLQRICYLSFIVIVSLMVLLGIGQLLVDKLP